MTIVAEGITRDDVCEVLHLALEASEIVEARLHAVEAAARRLVATRRGPAAVDPAALAELAAVLLEGER